MQKPPFPFSERALMRVRIIPSTRDGQHQLLTSYLINDTLAIDAGAIAIGLSHEQQRAIRSIVITHTHLDHIVSLPLYITEMFEELREPVRLFATASDFEALTTYIFNPRVWISLSILKNQHTELLSWQKMESGVAFATEGITITPIPVDHTVQTHAMLAEDEESAVLFTSDTGTTDDIWAVANNCPKLRAVFIDVSFPASLTELGRASRHHSVTTLMEEMEKIPATAKVYAIHLKPIHRQQITREIAEINHPRIVVAEIGEEYHF
jgi:ribonuclease BN (tRNA processing enzyme)